MANKSNLYIIPENFIEGGKVFNGMFKVRNLVDAIILALAVGGPLFMIHFPSLKIKAMVMIICVAPFFLIGAAGVNGDPLSTFIVQLFKWRKNKRIMLYNAKTRSRAIRPTEVLLSQELAKDKVVQAVDNWREKQRLKNNKTDFIEGEDFVFAEEDESFISAENKLISNAENTKNKKSKMKKLKKGKDTLLITEKSQDIKKENNFADKKSEVKPNDNNIEITDSEDINIVTETATGDDIIIEDTEDVLINTGGTDYEQ